MRARKLTFISLCATALLAGAFPATLVAAPAQAATTGARIYVFDSSLVLTAAKAARGASVKVEPTGGARQKWVFAANGRISLASAPGLCLNVPRAKYQPGVRLQLWTCDRNGSERFDKTAPSSHTRVFLIKPAARASFCVTVLGVPPPSAGQAAGLDKCAGLATQGWSGSNLTGLTDVIADAWVIQARHPATPGSAVTATSNSTAKLGQFWTSSFTGGREASPVLLHPVEDTALCVALPAGQATGVALTLATCDGSASQQLMGIGLIFNTNGSLYFITTSDGASCVQVPATGLPAIRNVVLGRCRGNSLDLWITRNELEAGNAHQYGELSARPDQSLSMAVPAAAGAGTGVFVAQDLASAGQVWTDLAPGQPGPSGGNANGTITLRLLSNDHLCLSVPNTDYAAGVQLTVQACDGGVNQEFWRAGTDIANTQELIAAGDGQFCVGEPGAVGEGQPVDLEPCDGHAHQAWSQFFDWFDWGGLAPHISLDNNSGPPFLVLASSGPTNGTVALSSSVSTADTSKFWTAVQGTGGFEFELQSINDPGLCLSAPSATVGTQMAATQCSEAATQTFQASFQGGFISYQLHGSGKPGLCVAATSTSSGPIVLQTCVSGEQDELWSGPS